jgi:hypothetical protein
MASSLVLIRPGTAARVGIPAWALPPVHGSVIGKRVWVRCFLFLCNHGLAG